MTLIIHLCACVSYVPLFGFGSFQFGKMYYVPRTVAEVINGIGATGPKRLRRLCEKELHLFMTRQHLANNAGPALPLVLTLISFPPK